jgi:hypothetical protein
VDLLSHLFKLLSRIMLDELIVDTDLYQSASQAGFGAGVGRGCRTQLLRKRLFIDRVLALGLVGALALFDYSGAFDGSSHKALDSTLEEAGTWRKVRAVHRSICEQANGTLRIRDAGETHLSNPFDINRGSVKLAVLYDYHISQIERFEIHRLPLVSVQILANAVKVLLV